MCEFFKKHSKLLIKIHEFFLIYPLGKIHPIKRILNMLHNKLIFPSIFINTISLFSFNHQSF